MIKKILANKNRRANPKAIAFRFALVFKIKNCTINTMIYVIIRNNTFMPLQQTTCFYSARQILVIVLIGL